MISPADIRRYIQIACVLEPLSYKKGCTTRYQDVTPTLKIENFIVAGINIGDAFEELAKRIIKNNNPNQNICYDLCLKAQKDSLKNRGGHRVNQGMIEFLFPIVISQLTYKEFNPYYILKRTNDVLENTKKQDVVNLQKMRNFAFSLWEGHHKHLQKTQIEFNNVYEFYNQDSKNLFYNEIINRYPILTEMLNLYYDKFINKGEQIEANEYQKSEVCNHDRCNLNNLSDAMGYVYEETKKEHPTISNGIIADLIVCLIYLLLSCNKKFIV